MFSQNNTYLTPGEIKQGAFKVHNYDMIRH